VDERVVTHDKLQYSHAILGFNELNGGKEN
jgi:hypothetical protein